MTRSKPRETTAHRLSLRSLYFSTNSSPCLFACCRGAPDWIVEVVFPQSASRDYIRKRQLYENRGVREYWIVHPVDRMVAVFVADRHGRFGAPDFFDAEARLRSNVLPELTVELTEIFA